MKLEVGCQFCKTQTHQEVKLPPGWTVRGAELDAEGFCPDHAKVAEFVESQCPGCVEGWGDCGLWKSFAYDRVKISAEDHKMLRAGRCPYRTNSTFEVGRFGVERLDISTVAQEAGVAVSEAINDFIRNYQNGISTS